MPLLGGNPLHIYLAGTCFYEYVSVNEHKLDDLCMFPNEGQNDNFALLEIYYLFIEPTLSYRDCRLQTVKPMAYSLGSLSKWASRTRTTIYGHSL